MFARMADGGAQPVRRIEGQKTLLGRTMHAIAYNETRDEFVVPQQFGQAILTFRGQATGEEPPIRVIQGSRTGLIELDRLAIDPMHNEIFVPEGDQVLVFPLLGTGNVAPIRVLKGPDTLLGASTVAVDPVHNLLTVVGGSRREGTRIMIFDRTASGNTKPLRVIQGANTRLGQIGGPHAVYPPTGRILVTIRSQQPSGGMGERMTTDDGFVGVWSINDNGNVPPRWTIGGPQGVLQMVRGVAVNPKHKELIVTDKRLNAILTFYFPELFM
ncbi:MAG: hypothetical protein ACRD88_12540 [Terriglobia bacterium]